MAATLLQFGVGTWWLMALPTHIVRLFMGGNTWATSFFALGFIGSILALFFRTALSLFIVGIFGFLTAVFFAPPQLRNKMLGYCSRWLIFPLPVMLLSAWWYLAVLPDAVQAMILDLSPEIAPALVLFSALLPAFLILGLIMRLNIPSGLQVVIVFVCLLTGLVYMGSFEWIREAGREIFRIACMGCHSIGGPINNILPLPMPWKRPMPHLPTRWHSGHMPKPLPGKRCSPEPALPGPHSTAA